MFRFCDSMRFSFFAVRDLALIILLAIFGRAEKTALKPLMMAPLASVRFNDSTSGGSDINRNMFGR